MYINFVSAFVFEIKYFFKISLKNIFQSKTEENNWKRRKKSDFLLRKNSQFLYWLSIFFFKSENFPGSDLQ